MANRDINKSLLDMIAKQVAASSAPSRLPVSSPAVQFASQNPYPTTSTVNNATINSINEERNPNFLNRIIDVISRPAYAVRNTIKDSLDPNLSLQDYNPLESFWAGLSGVDKTMTRDIIEMSDEATGNVTPDWQKGIGGFIGDVALDPTSYTTFGIGTAAKAGLRATSRILSGAKKYEQAIASGAGIVPDVVTAADVKALAAKKLVNAKSGAVNAERRARIGDNVTRLFNESPTVTVETIPRVPKVDPVVRTVTQQGVQARKITEAAMADAKAQGYQNTAFLNVRVIPELKRFKEGNAAAGIYPVVKLGDNAYHLDVADVFEALGPKLGDHYFKTSNRLAASTITTAGAKAIELKNAGLFGDDAINALAKAIEPGIKGTGSPRAHRLANDIWANVDNLEQRLIGNEYTYGLRDVATGKKIGNDVAAETVAKLADPNIGVAENLQDVANISGKIKEKAALEGVSPGGALIAAREASIKLGNNVPPSDVASARAIQANSRDIAKGADPAKVSRRQRSLALADAKKELEANPKVRLEDVTDVVVGNGIQRFYGGLQSRTIHGIRQADLAAVYRNWDGPAERLQHTYTTQLSNLNKKFDKPTFEAAFQALKVPGLAADASKVADPEVVAAMEELKPLLEHILSLSLPNKGRDIIAESAIFRNGLDLDTINMLLKEKGIPHQFEPAKDMAEVALQWRNWDIKDPLDFLSKMQAAVVEGAARKQVGEHFTMEFGSKVPKPGYIKIKQTDAKMSRFIDPEMYYPNEAVHYLRLFNNTFDLPTSFRGERSAAAWLSNNVIDPYLRLWKPAVTIARPGHHIRNAIGDFMMNGMAGVWSPKHYLKAANIQRALGKFNGDIFELEKLMGKKLPGGGDTALTVTLRGGKQKKLNYNQSGQLAFQHGVMTSYKAAEDILEKASVSKLDKATDWIMETKYMKAAGAVSEVESHHFRLAQWAALMGNPKFTGKYDNLKDASMAATTEVQRFHPDTKGLAPFEAKVMRRIIPFYTWFKQAMPIVFNTMLVKPGRVTTVPKAYFNAQVAMGLDPQSMEDPFPSDKMYPSFIQEHLTGPLSAFGANFTANTGTPLEGAGDILNGNVPTNLVGMLNPLMKAPIELATKEKIISGSYVPDRGEYIDQLIPFVNQVANLSGYSPSGTVANTLSGTEPKLDPQRAMQKGEKDFLFNQSTLNFLLGLGIQNLDRPSYQKITAREQRG